MFDKVFFLMFVLLGYYYVQRSGMSVAKLKYLVLKLRRPIGACLKCNLTPYDTCSSLNQTCNVFFKISLRALDTDIWIISTPGCITL